MTTRYDEIKALTKAEVDRQTAALHKRRKEITSDKVVDFPLRQDDEKVARVFAKSILEGESVPPLVHIGDEVERRGIDIVLKIMASRDLIENATEAVVWLEENREEWCRLAKEIILTMVKLEAQRGCARELLEGVDISIIRLPVSLLSQHLQPTQHVPLEDLIVYAMSEGIVTAEELASVTA